MKQKLLLFSLLLSSCVALSQKRILVFHETNGFRHGSISAGISMFEDLGNENNQWITDNSDDSSVFTATNLANYDAIVFLNTSGTDETGADGDLLAASEKQAFEDFIASGKGFIGVHAATDTYRDGVWPFYNELVGGIVQTNPNHTSNNFNADMTVVAENEVTSFLGAVGAVWNKNEEYYYWKNNGGQLSSGPSANTVLLEVEQTVGPNGMINDYHEARPITWLKENLTYNTGSEDVTVSGFRSFYTALGHNSSDYSSNTNFRTMLKNATLWAIGETLSIGNERAQLFGLVQNPVDNEVEITVGSHSSPIYLKVFDAMGKQLSGETIDSSTLVDGTFTKDSSTLASGMYVYQMTVNGRQEIVRVIKR